MQPRPLEAVTLNFSFFTLSQVVETITDTKKKKKDDSKQQQQSVSDPLSGGSDPLSMAASDPLSAAVSDPLSAVLMSSTKAVPTTSFGAPAVKVRYTLA